LQLAGESWALYGYRKAYGDEKCAAIKKAALRAAFSSVTIRLLDSLYVAGLWAFLALGHFKAYTLAFSQCFEA
jgi:hypothetical protein